MLNKKWSVLLIISLLSDPTITSQGACPPPQIEHKSCGICYKHYAPVCASNGETFSNECVFECFKKENEVEGKGLCTTWRCPNRLLNLVKVTEWFHCLILKKIENIDDGTITYFVSVTSDIEWNDFMVGNLAKMTIFVRLRASVFPQISYIYIYLQIISTCLKKF